MIRMNAGETSPATRYSRTYRAKYPEKVIAKRIAYREKVLEMGRQCKLENLAHYGPAGVMQCSELGCDITDPDMLSLDHVRDDGAKDRKELGLQGRSMYFWLKSHGYPEGFQTLCMNHQFKKEANRRRRK